MSHHHRIRLWVSEHNNGWEAWVAQLQDGTYTAWACPAKENAVAMFIEDSFVMACAAAHFDLVRLSRHDTCGPGCTLWEERAERGRFGVPATCPHCAAVGTVVLETTIVHGSVSLTWCCKACNREWPLNSAERLLIERRGEQAERRRVSRSDRGRRKSS